MLHVKVFNVVLAMLLLIGFGNGLRTFTRCSICMTSMGGSDVLWSSKDYRVRMASKDDFKQVASLLADEMYGSDPIPKGQRNELIR